MVLVTLLSVAVGDIGGPTDLGCFKQIGVNEADVIIVELVGRQV